MFIRRHCEVGRRIKHLQGGTQTHTSSSTLRVATCLLTHRRTQHPPHPSPPPSPTVQFPLKHPQCPFGERGDGWREGKRQGWVEVEGWNQGPEDYPCMQNHKFSHPGRGLKNNSHTHPHTALSGGPSGPVAVLYQVSLATSQTASITSHAPHCPNCTMARLNGYTVFMYATITVLAYIIALPLLQPAEPVVFIIITDHIPLANPPPFYRSSLIV